MPTWQSSSFPSFRSAEHFVEQLARAKKQKKKVDVELAAPQCRRPGRCGTARIAGDAHTPARINSHMTPTSTHSLAQHRCTRTQRRALAEGESTGGCSRDRPRDHGVSSELVRARSWRRFSVGNEVGEELWGAGWLWLNLRMVIKKLDETVRLLLWV